MKTFLPFFAALLMTLSAVAQVGGPQLVFTNPVLKSGTANKQGAVYRFSNVTPEVDAEIKLKKFSRNDIVMSNIDNASLGWDKAFQPEFGLPGLVQPNQHWYIDFEMTFFETGTNKKQKMDTVDLTALDVDGDGNSIKEYVTYDHPSSIVYSTVSYLTSIASGVLGAPMECGEDNIVSPLLMCVLCLGDGQTGLFNNEECTVCDGSGKIHTLCLHAYQGGTGSTVNGPINNFLNIDTAATQVMATYQFLKKDKIKFRYGGKSGSLASNGSGVRLNSTWFRKFSLAPVLITLPAKMESFTAIHYNNTPKVELKWITSSEINVSHYMVEKSFDGKSYNDAGLVFAYGNSSEKMTYTFTDNINTDRDKVVYYRLRTVDLDGKIDYSLTRVIRNSKQNETIASILTYPNPVMNELRVTIPNNWQGKSVSYEIFNAGGIAHQKTVASSGSQTETLNVSNLAPGMYLVKASCGEETAQQKIIKR